MTFIFNLPWKLKKLIFMIKNKHCGDSEIRDVYSQLSLAFEVLIFMIKVSIAAIKRYVTFIINFP